MANDSDSDIDWDIADDLIKTLKVSDDQSHSTENDCDHDNVILDDGNYVCKECNCLVYRYIDQGAEWRFYGSEQKGSDPTRCGLPTSDLLPNSSLGSIIGFSNNEKYAFKLMRKYHMWGSMSYKERSLYSIFESITITALNNGIPKSIIDEAKVLYKTISESRISRGENRSGIIATSIYIACKKNNCARSTKEIAKIFNLNIPAMTKGSKKFHDVMKLNMNSTQSSDFINRFCSKVDLNNDQKQICKKVAEVIDKCGLLSENTPPSVAAGVLFMCSEEFGWKISKKYLADHCEISQVTISKCFKKLQEYKEPILKHLQQV